MANTKKTTTATKVDLTPEPQRYKGLDMSRIFWGLLLVLVGVLVLLGNLGVVTVRYENLWQLWPLLIVGWGVSLLNIKGTLWSVVSALLVVGMLGLLTWAAIGAEPFRQSEVTNQTQRIAKAGDTTDRVEVTVDAGAGNITIGPNKNGDLVEALLQSDGTSLDVDSRVDGAVQKIEVSTEGNRMWWIGSFRNDLNVNVTKSMPVDVRIKSGAAELDADVSKLLLDSLDVDLGASRGVITIGNLRDVVDVNLQAGASSLTLRVPKDSGVSVQLDEGLSLNDLDGLQDKGNERYETDGYVSASKKINIRGDIGATSFKIERY